VRDGLIVRVADRPEWLGGVCVRLAVEFSQSGALVSRFDAVGTRGLFSPGEQPDLRPGLRRSRKKADQKPGAQYLAATGAA
jgi:hypothetical protein